MDGIKEVQVRKAKKVLRWAAIVELYNDEYGDDLPSRYDCLFLWRKNLKPYGEEGYLRGRKITDWLYRRGK